MSTPAIKFCLSCGAPRHGNAAFCGACGNPFPATNTSARQAPVVATTVASEGSWRVITGEALPEASQLFGASLKIPASGAIGKSASVMPASRNRPLWGSAIWMSLTQAADVLTRSMEAGSQNDPYLSIRLGIAAAAAVLGLTLAPLPRLRSILVRLGTLAIAIIQGQGLVPVIQSVVADPSLIGALAPNLAAQAAGMTALLQLFIVARVRRS